MSVKTSRVTSAALSGAEGEVVGLMKVTRGLGNTSNTRGEDTEVTFYVDGAVVARQEAQSMTMFDLARIEVLRGPQGTLYGRNSTGGTINLVTAKLTEEFTGYVAGGRMHPSSADAPFDSVRLHRIGACWCA